MWTSALALLVAQAAFDADASFDAYELRLEARSADEACSVFTAVERDLLDAAIKRSRDDAVMQGASPGQLDGFERRHDETFETACRTAFDLPGVALHRQETLRLSGYDQARFDGRAQGWTAQRGGFSDEFAQWRIVQSLRQGAANFGIFQHGDETGLALSLRTGRQPAYAVAYLRDVDQAPEPVDLTAGGLLPTPGDDPVSAWGAPSDRLERIFATQALSRQRAGELAPASGEPAVGFVFPQALTEALTTLSPREGARIDLYDGTGTVIDRYWVEVGAFDAALAFMRLPTMAPQATTPPPSN
ncbi:hypothetical protein [Oceanicaulis sp. MMSF_3324]|uniref:hypothetical protein n=1 Tax=Oceanicaulis sp. MMSF_3324 TaxID=3046702 RepID=UPI00273F47C5|nr:hypothetical protein [Oceanicaulis sp. MMSF_3324]